MNGIFPESEAAEKDGDGVDVMNIFIERDYSVVHHHMDGSSIPVDPLGTGSIFLVPASRTDLPRTTTELCLDLSPLDDVSQNVSVTP